MIKNSKLWPSLKAFFLDVNMKKILLYSGCILLICLTVSCATSNNSAMETVKKADIDANASDEERYEALFDEFRKYNGKVCLGISGPYSDESAAIRLATVNCLQYLSYSKGLAMQVDYNRVANTDLAVDAMKSSAIGGTIDSLYLETSEEMNILGVVDFGGIIGIAVFATIPSLEEVSWKHRKWQTSIISIDGYNVASATSEQSYRDPIKAIEAATFRAAQAILDVDEKTINANNTVVKTKSNKGSQGYKNDTYSISGNRMSGFRAIDYVYNPADGRIDALVITKK